MMASNPSSPASPDVLRAGGLAAALGGLLLVVGTLSGWFAFADQSLREVADTTGFLVAVGVGVIGMLLLVLGVIALYGVQASSAGGWGIVGFVGALIGTVLSTASLWAQLFVVPSLAAERPEFLDRVSEGTVEGPLMAGLAGSQLVFALGWLLFAIATLRARVFSRGTAGALIVGALLLAVPLAVANVVFALVIAWMGYVVFRRGPADLQRPDEVGDEEEQPRQRVDATSG